MHAMTVKRNKMDFFTLRSAAVAQWLQHANFYFSDREIILRRMTLGKMWLALVIYSWGDCHSV